MSEKIIMRTGECLVAGGPPFTAAEPEVVIGELDGPVGTAIATLTGNQSAGHSKVFAIMNTDVQVRPVTLMVSKVTVKNTRYTNILMGTVQGAIANGVLDAVRNGTIPKEKANDLGIIVSVWLNPSIVTVEDLDHEALFNIHREATRRAITRHMKRAGRVWIRIFPDVPVTKKPTEVRMGKGKGSVEFWACKVKPGRIMFEIDGVSEDIAREALRLAAMKLPVKTRTVLREDW